MPADDPVLDDQRLEGGGSQDGVAGAAALSDVERSTDGAGEVVAAEGPDDTVTADRSRAGKAAWSDDRRGDPLEGDLDDDEQWTDSKWKTEPADRSFLASAHIADADPIVPFRIHGWLAERGTSVWFGTGSTGKTQLMLWMAAMIASRPEDRNRSDWLGGHINGTGHVLILTAEDSREQILGRIRDIVTRTMKQDEETLMRTCSRLHVMAYLSLTEKEFAHDNPSLFELDQKERVWKRTPVMKEIRRYIASWNRLHRDPEDKIVGVIMDSATSMAGFDSLDAQATTNFFFYLGRLCERRRIFWAIIGHTPKSVTISKTNPQANAASRLRGVAMWTTAPRMTVEVRHIQEWGRGSSIQKEEPELRRRLPGYDKKDILVVAVAKANLLNAYPVPRHLVRKSRGAFADITDSVEDAYDEFAMPAARLHRKTKKGANGEGADATEEIAEGSATPTGGARSVPIGRRRVTPTNAKPAKPRMRDMTDPEAKARAIAAFSPGTALVEKALPLFKPGLRVGDSFSVNGLFTFMTSTFHEAELPSIVLVHGQSGGGKNEARPGAINWHLERLVEDGLLERASKSRKTAFLLTARGSEALFPGNK